MKRNELWVGNNISKWKVGPFENVPCRPMLAVGLYIEVAGKCTPPLFFFQVIPLSGSGPAVEKKNYMNERAETISHPI